MKVVVLSFVFSVLMLNSFAQNTSSPYSIMGLGDIEKSYFDRTSGLGHTGVALSSDRYLVLANPASLSSLSDKFFHFEISSRYKSVNYSGTPISNSTANQSNDLQFKRVSLAIKVKKNWGMSFGILPYSNANYSFLGTKNIQGSPTSLTTYSEGSGSANLAYLSNSYQFFIGKDDSISRLKRKFYRPILSIGVQTSYLFGQFDHKEAVFSTLADSVLSTDRNTFYTNPLLKGGLQYKMQVSKHWQIALGATANISSSLNAQETLKITDGQTVLKETKKTRISDFKLPTTFTTGIAAILDNKYTFVADYNVQNWGNLNYRGTNYTLTNSSRISAGVQLSNNVQFRDGSLFERNFLQAGFFYNKSYLRVYGEQINDIGFTFGAGVQILKNTEIGKLALHATVEIGSRGTTNKGLIKENYSQFGLTLSYRDFWFTNIKRYD